MANVFQIFLKVFILGVTSVNSVDPRTSYQEYQPFLDTKFFDPHTNVPYGFFDQPNSNEYKNDITSPKKSESLAERYFNLFDFTTGTMSSVSTEDLFDDLANRYRINLTQISSVCPRDSCFASYNPSHRQAVTNLADLYKGRDDVESLLEMSTFLKSRSEIHRQVWYASLMRAQLMQMPDTLSMARPNPIYLFPTRFFPDSVMMQTNNRQVNDVECSMLDETVGADNGKENRLWYFREDVLLNAHHWIWHLLYPLNATERIDRRGESFYFFHHEMTARYIAERYSNNLEETIPFNFQLNSVVEEGYNPHLTDGISSTVWAARPPFQSLSAVLNDTTFEQLYNLTLNRDRVVDALFSGTLMRDNRVVSIHTTDSINELGELSEASTRSANPEFYGTSGYHNQGHLVLATLIGDAPRGSLGVMGDETTAMRDVIFYRWHRLVDMLFTTYKELHLAPYLPYEGEHPLAFDRVSVENIKVVADGAQMYNHLKTFWNTRYVSIAGGLDFNGRNSTRPPTANVCIKHLDHEEFTYRIKVVNNREMAAPTTVRIFLAPRFRQTPKGSYRFSMAEQRTLFFSLDSFTTTLQPGVNILKRRSIDSTLTASWPKSVERLRQDVMSGRREIVNCECGFPHHLLLPKGKEEGMIFDLFVMLTDGTIDGRVKKPRRRKNNRRPKNDIPQCIPSHIHCGIPGQSFPDSRPLGYPFDRIPFSVPKSMYYANTPPEKMQFQQVQVLEEYVRYVPNMATTQVLITHQNIQVMTESPRRTTL